MEPSIFLDFHLPNAATWFYFSLFLAVALFFQFARPLLAPQPRPAHAVPARPGLPADSGGARADDGGQRRARRPRIDRSATPGCWPGPAYWFARAIFDLTLVRRPTVQPEPDTGRADLRRRRAVRRSDLGGGPADGRSGAAGAGRQTARADRAGAGQATAVVQAGPERNRQHASPDDVRFWVERASRDGLPRGGRRRAVDDRAAALPGPRRGHGDGDALPARAVHRVPHRAVPPRLADGVPRVGGVLATAGRSRPGGCSGLAAGTSLFPALLFPLWFGFYARRGAVAVRGRVPVRLSWSASG